MPQHPPIVATGTPDPEFTAVLTRWFVPDGALVEAGQVICELETDLASTEMAAFASGTLHHLKREGDTVRRGDEFGRIT